MKSLSLLTTLFAAMVAVMANPLPQASNSLAATSASSFAAASSTASGSAEPTESNLYLSPSVANSNNGSALALPTFFSWDAPVLESGWKYPLHVKGFTHLTIRQDGTYTFSGHYDPTDLVQPTRHLITTWTVTAKGGAVYRFVYPDERTELCDVFSNTARFDVCDWKEDKSDIDIKNNWENIYYGNHIWIVEAHK